MRKPYNYWKNFNNAKKDMEGAIKKIGHYPSSRELQKNGFTSLLAGISKYHGGLYGFGEILGYSMKRHSPCYWQNKENRIQTIKKIINKIGYFPSSKELNELRYGSLLNAIQEFDGGIVKLRESFGYVSKRRPNGYWKNYENIKREIESLVQKLGHYPTKTELENMGYSGLYYTIYKKYGGIEKLREKLGYELDEKSARYLRNIDNIKKKIRGIIKEIGHYPTSTELIEIGHKNLLHGIQKYHGGYAIFRENMGYSSKRKLANYWKNPENRFKVIKSFIKDKDYFPTYKELKIYSGLLAAIQKYHGGYRKIKESMGYGSEVLSVKWNTDIIKKEIKRISKEIGHFPSTIDLQKMGHYGLRNAITKFYGSYGKFREELGEISKKRTRDYWKDFNNVKRKMEEIIKEMGHYPTSDELRKLGYSSLYDAISKYHSGSAKLKEILGFKTRPQSWKFIENVKTEIRKIIKELGHFPISEELKELGYSGLLNAIIKYHNGLNKLREEFGYNLKKRPAYYWQNSENVKKELNNVILKLGHFPTSSELRRKGYNTLYFAIENYHGGYGKIREVFGQSSIKKTSGYWQQWENLKKEIEPALTKFYNGNKRLPNYKELKIITNSVVTYAINKYFGGLRSVYKKLGYLPTISTEGFINFVENDEHLKEIVKRIGNDPITLYDVLAVKYGGILERKEFLKLFKEPSLREYLDDFINPITGIDDLVELVKHALPFDRDDRIKTILIKKGIENIIEQIGPLPQDGEIESKIAELDRKLYDL